VAVDVDVDTGIGVVAADVDAELTVETGVPVVPVKVTVVEVGVTAVVAVEVDGNVVVDAVVVETVVRLQFPIIERTETVEHAGSEETSQYCFWYAQHSLEYPTHPYAL
jgi:hypothetical protein